MIKKKIEDNILLEHLEKIEDDRREIFLVGDGSVRLSAVNTTRMINEMRANHQTGLLETYVLSQGYTAGSLLSSEVKGNDRILLTINCAGPIKGMNIEAWACGAVRGYLVNNPIPLEKPLSSLDTSPLYGPGFLRITKILEGSKSPFSGEVMLSTGHLAQDLAAYYRESEQTSSLFALSIDYDKYGRVWGSGGIMMQALPLCKENILNKLAELSPQLDDMAKKIGSGMSVREYVDSTFSSLGVDYLGRSPIGFSCPCNEKNFTRYLVNLPQKEKDEILKGEFPLVLQCFNCGTEYKFSEEQLKELFTEGKE